MPADVSEFIVFINRTLVISGAFNDVVASKFSNGLKIVVAPSKGINGVTLFMR